MFSARFKLIGALDLLDADRFFVGRGRRELTAELVDDAKRLVHVFADLQLRIEDVTHPALAIDHIRDAAGEDAEPRTCPVQLTQRSIGIADQRKRQPVTRRKTNVFLDGIGADPHDLGPRVRELFERVTQAAGLGGTAWGFVGRIEVQNEHPFARSSHLYDRSIVGQALEGGCWLTNGDHAWVGTRTVPGRQPIGRSAPSSTS